MRICTFISFAYGIYNEGSNTLFLIHQEMWGFSKTRLSRTVELVFSNPELCLLCQFDLDSIQLDVNA